jgi:hypothetical protein
MKVLDVMVAKEVSLSKIYIFLIINREVFKDAHIFHEPSIRKHIERQLVGQFERFVKQSILTDGRPPQK